MLHTINNLQTILKQNKYKKVFLITAIAVYTTINFVYNTFNLNLQKSILDQVVNAAIAVEVALLITIAYYNHNIKDSSAKAGFLGMLFGIFTAGCTACFTPFLYYIGFGALAIVFYRHKSILDAIVILLLAYQINRSLGCDVCDVKK